MKKLNNILKLLVLSFLIVSEVSAQSIPTLELTRNGIPTNNGFGVSTLPMQATFLRDAVNNSTFSVNNPAVSVTISFRNQQFTGLNYGSSTAVPDGSGGFFSTAQSTGLVFGGGPSLATDPVAFGATPYNRYNIIGEYGGNGGPTNTMFTSNPTATGSDLGTGINVSTGSQSKINGGFEVFTTAQTLFGSANGIGSRVYFGDLVLKFSSPQKNPVIHVAGLGGSYRYLPIGLTDVQANYRSTFFSTELELQNTGITSTLMSGNSFMQLSGNNLLNNNDANPNGGSILDPSELFNNLGAATGSVRLNGTVEEVVYRIYLQSGTASQFAWSVPGSLIQGASRDPFTGDIWYVSTSLDKPTQQISGNVYNDRDGLTDGDINKSAGIDNPKTNVGGTLFANLLNTSGQVVASTLVSSDGSYLFDAVPVGTYSIQLTINSSVGTYTTPAAAPLTTLPTNWVNTGEFNGNTPGNDGSINGRSASIIVIANDIRTQVNFGIERLPESVNLSKFIPTPLLNSVITLDNTSPLNLPILQGSDPEDQVTSGVLTSKTVKITTLPTTSQLLYAGVPVTVNQIITNFNPSLLQIKFTIAAPAGQTSFQYAYVDAAGLPDPTPATYTINWPDPGVLVITLAEFTAVKNNCFANLNWKTSYELNSEKFEVEVSSDLNTSFTSTGTVAASMNSTTIKNYKFGYAMETGVQYYFRLKMFNKDGTFTYSEIRKLSCMDVKTQIAIAPNPTVDMFKISGMEKGRNTILIYSNDGKLLNTQVVKNTVHSVDMSSYASGLYMVRVINENGSININRVVKK